MKKHFPPFVWHKRAGKMMSSKILQTMESPRGEEKKMYALAGTPAEQFVKKLKTQIRKSFIFWLCFMVSGFCFLGTQGCQKKEIQPPVGKWKREATYLNGEFNHERRATLTLTKTTFKLEESNCETTGLISYQQQAMILVAQQNDCPGFSTKEKLYYGYGIDPDNGKLRIFHNNQFNDEIREIYHKVE
jgi:hypothetical protein